MTSMRWMSNAPVLMKIRMIDAMGLHLALAARDWHPGQRLEL